MGLKLLVSFAALVAFAAAAPASPPHVNVSNVPSYIQYLLPMTPNEDLLLAKGVVGAGAGKLCNLHQLQSCQVGVVNIGKTLAGSLGQPVTIFNDPDRFAELVFGLYKQSITDGLLKLCNAHMNFRSCLSIFYEPCTDPFNIYRDQLKGDLGKAFTLAGVYDDIEFDCGGGLTQGIINWGCIRNVNNKPGYADAVKACWTAYREALQNPDNYCSAGQTLSTCLTSAYKNLDQCVHRDVQWWVCERANRRSRLEGFCEENSCSSIFPPEPTTPPRIPGVDSFMEFVESGELLSPAKLKFLKLIGIPREKRILAAKQQKL